MKFLFWSAAGLIAYAYFGYGAWLWILKRFGRRPIRRAPQYPKVSLLMVVRNEQDVIERKLNNLEQLDYPPEMMEYVMVSDGSSDHTNQILNHWSADVRFKLIFLPESAGKANGLNQGMRAATGEIVVLTDARQHIEGKAVRLLVENFADEQVGCASGELVLGDPDSGESIAGMGLYWRMEKWLRDLESQTGSVIGATGALYAIRRDLFCSIPDAAILDDVYLPMCVARQGKRVVFDGRARAWDQPNLGAQREFGRKVRTLSGNYQLLHLAPWLLSTANRLRFRFISHKLSRLIVPFALAAIFVASVFLHEPVYRIAFILQVLFYALSVLGLARISPRPVARLADAAATLVLLNTAAVVAFTKFITRRQVAWGGHDRVVRTA
ncbi:MAG TPA: glycosyltransferase family 2 protein [Terriglobales bacterium]